eukprot:1160677-Pelagomonas_calceolata.AAC.4
MAQPVFFVPLQHRLSTKAAKLTGRAQHPPPPTHTALAKGGLAEAGLGAQGDEVETELAEKVEKEDEGMQGSDALKSTCTTDYDFAPSSLEALASAVAGLAGCSITGALMQRVKVCVGVCLCGLCCGGPGRLQHHRCFDAKSRMCLAPASVCVICLTSKELVSEAASLAYASLRVPSSWPKNQAYGSSSQFRHPRVTTRGSPTAAAARLRPGLVLPPLSPGLGCIPKGQALPTHLPQPHLKRVQEGILKGGQCKNLYSLYMASTPFCIALALNVLNSLTRIPRGMCTAAGPCGSVKSHASSVCKIVRMEGRFLLDNPFPNLVL